MIAQALCWLGVVSTFTFELVWSIILRQTCTGAKTAKSNFVWGNVTRDQGDGWSKFKTTVYRGKG